MNLSLRTKGILAVSVLIGYLAIISVFLAHQRQKLVQIVGQMEATQQRQMLLRPRSAYSRTRSSRPMSS